MGARRRAKRPGQGSNRVFPTDLTSFLELIRQNGDAAYSLIFAFSSAHSLILGLFAGYAAHAGALSLGPLVATCWLGSFAGDVFRFWIGRKFGLNVLSGFPRIERIARNVAALSERHHVLMILSHRYPHGIRGVAGFAYGMSNLPWPTFLFLNFVAAGLWSVAVVLAGYTFGRVSEGVLQDASSRLGLLMLVAFLGVSWLLSRRLDRGTER